MRAGTYTAPRTHARMHALAHGLDGLDGRQTVMLTTGSKFDELKAHDIQTADETNFFINTPREHVEGECRGAWL